MGTSVAGPYACRIESQPTLSSPENIVDHYGPLRGRCGSSSTKEQLAEVTAATQDEDAVTLGVRGPDDDYRLRARYLVGCDGAHSLVRKQAGIGFPGVTSTEVSRIGRVFLPTATITRGGGEVNVPGVGRLRLMGQVSTRAASTRSVR